MSPTIAFAILTGQCSRPRNAPRRAHGWRWAAVGIVATVAVLMIASPAHAQATSATITGPASAVDGDTIHVGFVDIRLFGIDAPESAQTCTDNAGADWPCGSAATQSMAAMIAGSTITCRDNARDRWNRVVATCWPTDAAGHPVEPSLNERLVLQGLAVSFVRYSHSYDASEAIARLAGSGMWSGSFEMPWNFRLLMKNASQPN